MNKVIAGDYKGMGVSMSMRGVPIITLSMGKSVTLDKATVARYEVIDQQTKTGFSAGKAVAGAALFGDVGVIAEAGGKRKDTYMVAIYFRDGKSSLLEIDGANYKLLVSELFGVENYDADEEKKKRDVARQQAVEKKATTKKKVGLTILGVAIYAAAAIVMLFVVMPFCPAVDGTVQLNGAAVCAIFLLPLLPAILVPVLLKKRKK